MLYLSRPMSPRHPQSLASPAVIRPPTLRVLGTSITIIDPIVALAEADLGFKVEYEVLDFISCQRKAALEPGAYDVYDQCFHNLDIVWFWGALQPLDTLRLDKWDEVSDLTKRGRISRHGWQGHGDAPVKKLYVQPGGSLGSDQSRFISMLPTVHNLDSFGYDVGVFGSGNRNRESWAWLLDPRAKGRIALVDEPAIGIFDAALAAEASGAITFRDIGNLDVQEIDALMDLLEEKRQQGFFRAVWRDADEARHLIVEGRTSVQSMWSPAYWGLGEAARRFVESVPVEGYRAWHGGISLAHHVSGRLQEMAYEYMNWWLSGRPGALMARQGYYMSVAGTVRHALADDEWSYWYGGEEAIRDLPGPDGEIAVRAGTRRAGGSYWDRANRIAVWNTVMDEHNYAVRAWNRFVARVRGDVA